MGLLLSAAETTGGVGAHAHCAALAHAPLAAASPWIARWAHLVPRELDAVCGVLDAPCGVLDVACGVLDVACGSGRHLRFFSQQNHLVAGVDSAKSAIESIALLNLPNAELVCADVEHGPWPFAGRQFAGVVVTNYLWRPLLPTLVASVAPGGVLLYETFAAGNETVGRPSRPDFLLQPGELLAACAALRVVAYEDGFMDASSDGPARFVQRIAAVRPPTDRAAHQKLQNPASILPTRYPL